MSNTYPLKSFDGSLADSLCVNPGLIEQCGPEDQDILYSQVLTIVHIKSYPGIDQQVIATKRLFDIIFSVTLMILGIPVFLLLCLITKLTSSGPTFYKQKRIGKNGRPFYIYKFRSMHINAEKHGPQLSSEDDPRITKWGRIIRRTRMDELPQFWNVLLGDMSVVGPRPEREYFINQIIQRNPDYSKLQQIRPGVTSMGQVFFGYAENVDQMCTRMMYDLCYLDNLSIKTDLKVILKTIRVMFECKGK